MVMKVKLNFCKYCSWSVHVFACHVIILFWTTASPELYFATLVIIKKLTDGLLRISVTFTWLYKIENIVGDWNRFFFSPYSHHIKYCFSLMHGKLFLSYVITKF